MTISAEREVSRGLAKSWRWPKTRTLLLACLAAIPMAFAALWMVSSYFASKSLRHAQADANRMDPFWHFEEILARRAVIPFEQNSARQVALAHSLLKGGFPAPPKLRPRGPFAPAGAPPFFREPLTNRLDRVPSEERLDVALSAELRRELRRVGSAVDEARKLANMSHGRTDPKYAKLVWATLIQHVQNSRDVARLLAADAAILAQDGEFDLALADARAIIAVAQSIGDEPFIISQLVRIAVTAVSLATVERILNQGVASDQALEQLQVRLLEECAMPLAVWGLRGERAACDSVMSQLASGEVPYRTVAGAGGNEVTMAAEVLSNISSAYVQYNQGLVLARMNEAVEIAKRPFAEQPALWEQFDARITEAESKVSLVASSLSRQTMPSVSAFNLAYLRSRAQMYAMVVALAAERHRLAHGQFPERIEAIDRRYLSESTVDPFSGGPLILRPDGEGGILVYSVSHDRKDGGGTKITLKTWMAPGADIGVRLRSVPLRGRLAKLQNLPDDVLQERPEASESDRD